MSTLTPTQIQEWLLQGHLLPNENWFSLCYCRPYNLLVELVPRRYMVADEPEHDWDELTNQMMAWLEADAPELVRIPKLPDAERRLLWQQFVAAQSPEHRRQLEKQLPPERLEAALRGWRPYAFVGLVWECEDETLHMAWQQTLARQCLPELVRFCQQHGIPSAGVGRRQTT